MLIINSIKYNNEFIATYSSDNSILANYFLKLSSYSGKNLVTIHMAIYIIDLLEMVYIKNSYCNSVILLFLETFYSICCYCLLIVHMCKGIKL